MQEIRGLWWIFLHFYRTLEGEPTYTFVFNLGDKLETIKLADEGEGEVVVRSSYSPNYVVG